MLVCSLHTERGPGVKSPMQHQAQLSYRPSLTPASFLALFSGGHGREGVLQIP